MIHHKLTRICEIYNKVHRPLKVLLLWPYLQMAPFGVVSNLEKTSCFGKRCTFSIDFLQPRLLLSILPVVSYSTFIDYRFYSNHFPEICHILYNRGVRKILKIKYDIFVNRLSIVLQRVSSTLK